MDNEQGKNIHIEMNGPDDYEVYGGVRKKQRLKGMDYGIMFLDFFDDIGTDKDLTVTDIRVLFGLLGEMKFENEINVTQTVLSKKLKIAQQDISASIQKLIKKEYILILRKEGKKNIYYFNPHLGIKAKPEHKAMLDRAWNERIKASKESIEETKDAS